MAPIENHPVCADEDLDDDDESEEEEEVEDRHFLVAPSKRLDEIDEEDPDQDNGTSSSNLVSGSEPILPNQLTLALVSVAADPVSALQTVTIALPPATDFKRQRIDTLTIPGINNTFSKPPPLPPVFDESRRLFQRLWTDEDEIELLQGFLDYTKKRRFKFNSGSGNNNNAYHHDTSAFHEQIKTKLQLDFNKNQLMEKLRRLKKKYTTIINKVGSGKEYVFKSPHDEATFEICKKIWSSDDGGGGGRGNRTERRGLEDDNDTNPNPNPNPNHYPNSMSMENNGLYPYPCSNSSSGGSGKRFRGVSLKMQEVKSQFHQLTRPTASTPTPTPTPIPCLSLSLIEETVGSCLPPLLKDLLQNYGMNCGGSSSRGGLRGGGGGDGDGGGGMGINPFLPFGLLVGGNLSSLSGGGGGGGGGDVMEEKWRKQEIMELEVYSKRLELVQDEIKSALDDLRRRRGQ